jgi:hypothetical protein
MDGSEIRTLQEQLEAQQEELEHLKAEMAELRDGRHVAGHRPRGDALREGDERSDERSSRRDLLRKAGVAAGGAVALAGMNALPAAAQDDRAARGFSSSIWMSGSGARCYDSRPGRAPLAVTKGKITNTEVRTIQVSGFAGVLSSDDACIINLTAVETSQQGFLAAYQNGIPFPGTSALNWSSSNDIIANGTVVNMDTNGRIAVRCSGSTHFIVDVIGSYVT